jgi:predicted transglutaminase-like cysteine proteinase
MGPRLWALLASIIWVVSPAEAGPRLLGAGDAPSLPAWVEFCQASPVECTIDPSEPEFVTLTPDTYALLQSVNLSVNSTLRPITDQHHWGLADLWSYPGDGAGDCEDFQLLKRKFLVEAGLPRRAMLMTVVLDEKDEGHAILTVRTDRQPDGAHGPWRLHPRQQDRQGRRVVRHPLHLHQTGKRPEGRVGLSHP